MTDHSPSLGCDVYVSPREPMPADDLAPGERERSWSPIAATLISGERDAVLLDARLTVGQAHDLVEWISPDRINPDALWSSAQGVKPSRAGQSAERSLR